MIKNFLYQKNLVIPLILAILFSFAFSYYSIYRHFTFQTNSFDLGTYSQISYLYSHKLSFYSSLMHMPLIADHFEPILLLLAPFYKLFPTPITLLVIQAFMVGLSSIPIYLIASHKIKSVLSRVLITLAYLSHPGILAAINFDFHTATISLLPLSLILYTWYFKKWRLYWAALLFALLFKEDIPLFILGLGIFEIIQKQRKQGIATISLALISFYLIKYLFMPFLSPGAESSYIASSMLPLDDPITLLIILIQHPTFPLTIMLNSPMKIATTDIVLKPFAFFSILSPLSWLTAIPYLFLRFSTTNTQYWSNNFHYNANLVPFLAVSAILAIEKYKIPKKMITISLLFALILGGLSPFSLVWSPKNWFVNDTSSYSYIYNSLAKIPTDAAVSAQSPIVPHLINREKIYLFPEIYDAQYIVLNTKLNNYPLKENGLNENITALKSSKEWQVIDENKGMIIFKKLQYTQ